jgi:hypothetical protein
MGFIGQEQGHFEVLPVGPSAKARHERLPCPPAVGPASGPASEPAVRAGVDAADFGLVGSDGPASGRA